MSDDPENAIQEFADQLADDYGPYEALSWLANGLMRFAESEAMTPAHVSRELAGAMAEWVDRRAEQDAEAVQRLEVSP